MAIIDIISLIASNLLVITCSTILYLVIKRTPQTLKTASSKNRSSKGKIIKPENDGFFVNNDITVCTPFDAEITKFLFPDQSHVKENETVCTIRNLNGETDIIMYTSGIIHYLTAEKQTLTKNDPLFTITPDTEV